VDAQHRSAPVVVLLVGLVEQSPHVAEVIGPGDDQHHPAPRAGGDDVTYRVALDLVEVAAEGFSDVAEVCPALPLPFYLSRSAWAGSAAAAAWRHRVSSGLARETGVTSRKNWNLACTNGIQEADGSIPFSSTKAFRIA
jgi:hypothetical protein